MHRPWPDQIDLLAISLFSFAVIGVPVIGYWLMVADYRAYLRALRGALMIVRYHLKSIPNWARRETPGCIKSLGLRLPCTEEEIKEAYRRRAEQLHPDRGGDRRRFALLKSQYEEAVDFIRDVDR